MLYNLVLKSETGDDFLKGKKLAIIGAGASGLAAAIEASLNTPNLSITLFDKMMRAGKKLLATGNGRCNFTNMDLSPSHFYGERNFLRKILTSQFADSVGFFRELGVLTYTEDNRIYPRSQQASAIREALCNATDKPNIRFNFDITVSEIEKKENKFILNDEEFDAVIVCGGGKASPSQGSDGSCYNILSSLGHKITPVYPALCGLTTNDKALKSLKGVRAECNARLYNNDILLGQEIGEVQFTDKGISGIPVMNLSHRCKNHKNLLLSLDLAEEFSETELTEHIKAVKSASPNIETECLLNGILNNKLGFAVMEKSGIKPHTTVNKLNSDAIRNLCYTIKNLDFSISGTRGFDNAQICCGGVDTNEIDGHTMMSQLVKGLFICGEVIDIHGDCGGYNLHLAWTTGRIAGYYASEFLK